MSTPLRYHHAILRLLGVEPTLSPERLALIEQRERVCGVRFPEAVREWFAVPNAEELFYNNSNQDNPIRLSELGQPDETRQGYLRVAYENQGVVRWYVELNRGDDPPVYDDNDSPEEDMKKTPWVLTSATFTEFIFGMLTIRRDFRAQNDGRSLSARDILPDDATLAQLREWFDEGPSTRTPTRRVYRFFTSDTLLVIYSGTADDLSAGVAEWDLQASTPEALEGLCRRLWHVGTLAQTLTARRVFTTRRVAGDELLDRLRAE